MHKLLSSVPEQFDEFKATEKNTRNRGRVSKPQPVEDYKDAMKGVGMCDQMSTYHTALRKTQRNDTKNGFELLTGTSVGNAWILYNKIIPNAIPRLNFNESLVERRKKTTPQKFRLTLMTLGQEMYNKCTY